jgi:ketosteroid isomerase-like protein
LLRVEADWNEAVVRRDAAALERILADGFVLVWVDGSVSGKRELIDAVKSRKAEIDPFTTQGVTVRFYGRTAVVVGAFSQTARLGERRETHTFRYTDVYHRQFGHWRAVSAHATLVR